MASGIVNLAPLYAAKHGELGAAQAGSPVSEDSRQLGSASPETVARKIAKRARFRVIAILTPLAFLVVLLLFAIGRVGF